MAVAGEVGGDSTVGTVGSSASGDSALDDDVVDDTLIGVEVVELSVSFQVHEELSDDLGGFLGPSTGGVLEDLALGVSSNASSVLSERNNLLVFKHVFHVLNCLLKFETLAGTSGLICVLVVSTEVRNLAFGR